ncbi:CLIP domain-containing serine protease B15-like [Sabethes cyaneus]|uniref:CLIP domain-containing serine protease B15-like n=1 Tax=Sabethes cyaneus TaxID=53552 RepID=UPI00237EE977|nr:CLIP domain-containing serine protease B15-like [Sabethes cyaneus]
MTRLSFLIVVLGLQTVVVPAEIHEICTTTTSQIGRCKLVKDCEYVRNIMRNPNRTHEEWYFLDYNKCGNVPADPRPMTLVCCPEVQNVQQCGVSKIGNRIFGGSKTIYGEIPWAGVIVYQTGKKRLSVKCGCTLLNSRWAITAAHCSSNIPNSWKIHRVRFSEWNINKLSPCITSTNVQICRSEYEIHEPIVHPLYQSSSIDMAHDIALIKTKKEVQFSDYVIPICLPFNEEIRELPIEQQQFTVTGWGQTNKGNEVGIQRHVTIAGQNNSVCENAFSSLDIKLSEEQICAGGEQGQDSCRGDSGGPLTIQHGLVNYLIGIVSFGPQECGTKNHPAIYTNVIKYLDWIEDTMVD